MRVKTGSVFRLSRDSPAAEPGHSWLAGLEGTGVWAGTVAEGGG